jgi:formyltetrahydrofolate deformylase
MADSSRPSAILLISCPDRTGIIAAVTEFLFRNRGNILYLDQHVDHEEGVFFMRVEWDITDFALSRAQIEPEFRQVAERFGMTYELHFSDKIERMAVFVSKQGHCLYDILSRWQSGEWRVHIPIIISNHEDMAPVAAQFGVEFRYFPVTKENKREMEEKQLALLQIVQPDFIVLARYMQILSADFIAHFPNRIINIHHSFLPAFINRGVKIVGATSHYVTAELDAGPILEQDVLRVNHRDTVEELVRKGRDVEKLVLSRAVLSHLRKEVLVYNNKTFIFS